jgi:four helix bundle protein
MYGVKTENVVRDKSYQFALKIIELVKKFPQRNEGYVIGRQLLRAGTSIGANIEEAIAAFSKQDFTFKMSIALKEARETHYWLRLINDSKIIPEDISILKDEAYELIKILTSIVKNSQGK